MKKLFTRILLCMFLLMGVQHARADHMVGSDITWECMGKDTFKITVTAYRDCNGIPFPNTPISLKPSCGGATIVAGGDLSGGTDITPVCKKACTRCKSKACDYPTGVPYGIEQYFITAIVVLPTNCCKFAVSWGHCCRSAGITTGPTWNDYYIEGELNRCTTPCDNSPYFTNPPVALYCAGQCVTYNQGVNDDDVDGNGAADSLAYFLAEPMQSKSSTVNWASPFSYKEPLTYDGFPGHANDGEWNPPKKCQGFTLDVETGELRFKAMSGGEVTVLAIRVEEWRKDADGKPQKIGEIRRDLQILIVDCPDNRSPIISGINGGNQVTMDFCAGQSKCFTINSFDVDDKDSVTMTSNVNRTIPGATFDVESGKRFPKGVFCWTPSNADVRSYPYRFVVTGVDDACPVNGRTSRSFGIKVNPSPEASYSATIGNCGLVTFKAFPGKITAIS
ncbi:MAG: hypothetical protein EOP53_10280, partial [Sphingobacteriales bacterium]